MPPQNDQKQMVASYLTDDILNKEKKMFLRSQSSFLSGTN